MLLYVTLMLFIVTKDSAAAAEVIVSDEAGQRAGDGAAGPCVPLDMVRRLRAREREYLASFLHDGPIQELAAMTLELALAQRDEPDGIAGRVDAVSRALSRLQDEVWPFPRSGSGLVETLRRRTAWLLTASLTVTVGEEAAGLAEADVQAVADVVEMIMAGLVSEGAWDQPVVTVRADPDLIFLELTMTSAPDCDPAGCGPAAVAWLRRLAAAIQAVRVRADVGLDDRRLRMLMAIPRRLPHRGASPGEVGGPPRKSVVQVPDHLSAGRLAESAPSARGSEQTILVVDDEPAVLSVAARILRENGYSVLEAANYDQALALAASREFQLLLTDSVMPHTSGATLAQRITQLRPGLPVLYMSGYGPAAAGASPGAHEAASMHLQKPFTAQVLLQAVYQALNAARSG